MRTVIFLSCILLACAINPLMTWTESMTIVFLIISACSIIMDIAEFLKTMFKKN